MDLEQGIQGFVLSLSSANRSMNTIAAYKIHLKKLCRHLENPALETITRHEMRDFMRAVREYRKSDGEPYSPRSVQAVWDACNIFFNWCVSEELIPLNPMSKLERPTAPEPEIDPLTKTEIAKLLTACEHTRVWRNTESRRSKRHTARRDKAIIALILDTGLRVSEVCNLRIGDVDLSSSKIKVIGKGRKERIVYLDKKAARYVWRYRAERENVSDDDFFFVSYSSERQMTRSQIYRLVHRAGKRAGIGEITVHQLRHTFAVEYLRNGGDVFTLQQRLGHSSLKQTRRYVKIAALDAQGVHHRVSPGNSLL